MRYMLLITGDEAKLNNLPEPQGSQRHAAWGTYNQALVERGQLRGGERLRPVASATTLRLDGGKRLLSDGPYAETKEQLGGFYVVEADNLDQAVEIAARMPHLEDGGGV